MSKFGKIRNISGKTSTHRSENIFPKYFIYNVHEIAQKYPREKKRYSSFSDSVKDKSKTYSYIDDDILIHIFLKNVLASGQIRGRMVKTF
jgi:hypothetical protein